MVLVGDEFSMEIGGPRVVEEHQWTVGKLVQVVIEAKVVRCGLPTGGLCAAGEEEDDGDGIQLDYWELDAGDSRTACGCGCSAATREREGVKAPGWPVHGDQVVAAGGSLGLPWRARVRPGGERKEVETGRGRRVEGCSSWRWHSGRGIGGERRWQEQHRAGSGGGQRRKKQRDVRRTSL
jgi:hypothetical protein